MNRSTRFGRRKYSSRALNTLWSASVVIGSLASLALLLGAPSHAVVSGENYNVIVILVDDLGIEHLRTYDLQPQQSALYPNTPVLEAWDDRWLVFENAWSAPLCSPTRTTALTGLYGFESGIGYLIGEGEDDLDLTRTDFLPKLLDAAEDSSGNLVDYATATFGKWHLGETQFGTEIAPIKAGFDYFKGVLFAPQKPPYFPTFLEDEIYEDYRRTEAFEDETFNNNEVNDSYLTEDTIDWIIGDGAASGFNGGWLGDLTSNEHFFIYLPLLAPHSPFHCPPANLIFPDVCNEALGDTHMYHFMIQVMDAQIGRLLTELEASTDYQDNTIVMFVGDNGSTSTVRREPTVPNRIKGTVFEGGIRVPFMMGDLRDPQGALPRLVDPAFLDIDDAFINTTDIYDTVLDLTNTDPPTPQRTNWKDAHSQSLWDYLKVGTRSGPHRDCTYSEVFEPNYEQGSSPMLSYHNRAILGDTENGGSSKWKYIRIGAQQGLFNLSTDPWESTNKLSTCNPCYFEEQVISELRACADAFSATCTRAAETETCTYSSDCCDGLYCNTNNECAPVI